MVDLGMVMATGSKAMERQVESTEFVLVRF